MNPDIDIVCISEEVSRLKQTVKKEGTVLLL